MQVDREGIVSVVSSEDGKWYIWDVDESKDQFDDNGCLALTHASPNMLASDQLGQVERWTEEILAFSKHWIVVSAFQSEYVYVVDTKTKERTSISLGEKSHVSKGLGHPSKPLAIVTFSEATFAAGKPMHVGLINLETGKMEKRITMPSIEERMRYLPEKVDKPLRAGMMAWDVLGERLVIGSETGGYIVVWDIHDEDNPIAMKKTPAGSVSALVCTDSRIVVGNDAGKVFDYFIGNLEDKAITHLGHASGGKGKINDIWLTDKHVLTASNDRTSKMFVRTGLSAKEKKMMALSGENTGGTFRCGLSVEKVFVYKDNIYLLDSGCALYGFTPTGEPLGRVTVEVNNLHSSSCAEFFPSSGLLVINGRGDTMVVSMKKIAEKMSQQEVVSAPGKRKAEDIGEGGGRATRRSRRGGDDDGGNNLAGMVICFTGSSVMSRSQMELLVRRNGGFSVPSVNSRCTHLVSDYPGGKKYNEAQKRGIPVLTTKQLLERIG